MFSQDVFQIKINIRYAYITGSSLKNRHEAVSIVHIVNTNDHSNLTLYNDKILIYIYIYPIIQACKSF